MAELLHHCTKLLSPSHTAVSLVPMTELLHHCTKLLSPSHTSVSLVPMTELLHHCAAQGHQLQVLISSIQQTLVNHLGKEENCNNQQAFSLFIIFCGNPNISMGKISTKHQILLGEDMVWCGVVCVCVCVCVPCMCCC